MTTYTVVYIDAATRAATTVRTHATFEQAESTISRRRAGKVWGVGATPATIRARLASDRRGWHEIHADEPR